MVSATSLRRAALGLFTGLSLGLSTIMPTHAAPLTREQLPNDLKDWVPWAMQGHEWMSCPGEHANNQRRECLWPEQLNLDIKGQTAEFKASFTNYGVTSAVKLPGESGSWPAEVKNQQGQVLSVSTDGDHPIVWLPPGKHVLSGRIQWTAPPQTVRIPRFGLVNIRLDGEVVNPVMDVDGRVWLRKTRPVQDTTVQNTTDITIRRLIDDDIPRRITTRYELHVAGEPREADLAGALLENTVPAALRSNLPARLYPDGRLQVQLKPGKWMVEVEALQMAPVAKLMLPAGSTQPEVWSYQARNELHVTQIEGVEAVDPRHAEVPDGWRGMPAYQLHPYEPMTITVNTRGNVKPPAGKLSLHRELWIDFDGKGMIQKDRIDGTLSDLWRLELSEPAELGFASARGSLLPITRLPGSENAPGIELRDARLSLSTLARIEDRSQPMLLNGWNTVMSGVDTRLNLPPGWMLLHASGMDGIEPPTLTSNWSLFDFFFLLLTVVAAYYLIGIWRTLILLPLLLLTWHELSAISLICQALLILVAVGRYLQHQLIQTCLVLGTVVVTMLAAGMLLPYTLTEIHHIMHPTLEHAGIERDYPEPYAANPGRVRAARVASEAYDAAEAAMAPQVLSSAAKSRQQKAGRIEQAPIVDNSKLRVQTGPGEPDWHWNQYHLHNVGDVLSDQKLELTLLSVWPARIFRVLRLLVIWAALVLLLQQLFATRGMGGMGSLRGMGGMRGLFGSKGRNKDASAPGTAAPLSVLLLSGLLGLGLMLSSAPVQAAKPAPIDDATLQALRDRLYPMAECAPHCAAVGQMQVDTSRHALTLRLSVHTQAQVQVPLPSVDATDNWRMDRLLVNGRPATSRRSADGVLWVLMPAGIHNVEIGGPIGMGNSIRLALPMPPQMLRLSGEQWQATGLVNGLPADSVLNLNLQSVEQAGQPEKQLAHVPDALPSFALVERTLILQERWRVETRITRRAVSNAPVRVRFNLLPGESVNDEGVQVRDGVAEVYLGRSQSVTLNSTLPTTASLTWTALPNPHQIEIWRLQGGNLWHTSWQGLSPIQWIDNGELAPWWQPWPGESLSLNFVLPDTLPGPTRTLQRQELEAKPGAHSTELTARLKLRASLAGIQPMQLPEGAEFLGLMLDGENVPIQPQQQQLAVPIVPGEHEVQVRWREARGTSGWYNQFPLSHLDTGLAGSNASIKLQLPHDRVVLATGGPLVGPAVLFWSLLVLLVVLSVLLARYAPTPLGTFSWLVLLFGVAPISYGAAFMLVGSIVGYCLLPRASRILPEHRVAEHATTIKTLMILMALLATAMLYASVKGALLGFPDMLITGNGSDAFRLNWYQDRFQEQAESAWVLSISLVAFRVLMLVWSLWMAFSVVRWVRWGIRTYIEFHRDTPTPPTPPMPPSTPGLPPKPGKSAASVGGDKEVAGKSASTEADAATKAVRPPIDAALAARAGAAAFASDLLPHHKDVAGDAATGADIAAATDVVADASGETQSDDGLTAGAAASTPSALEPVPGSEASPESGAAHKSEATSESAGAAEAVDGKLSQPAAPAGDTGSDVGEGSEISKVSESNDSSASADTAEAALSSTQNNVTSSESTTITEAASASSPSNKVTIVYRDRSVGSMVTGEGGFWGMVKGCLILLGMLALFVIAVLIYTVVNFRWV